ncbi:MAG: sulfatase-like hydrolase/transferase [Rickettsiales bacterium]|nr:sulfatase-like hydrolase/transferase [Rickettsiales bacterium]
MTEIHQYSKARAWVKIFKIFAAISFALRLFFLIRERAQFEFSAAVLFKVFAVGLFFDLLTLSYIAALPLAYYTFVSSKFFNSPKHQIANKIFYFLFLFVIVFSAFSEVVFWDEFQTRFNFIAVDYLIYTTEVIANIMESYPMGLLISAIAAISGVIFFFTNKRIVVQKEQNFFCRIKKFIVFAAFLSAMFFAVDSSKLTRVSPNNYLNETASNGIYQLFSAYRNNQIDYDQLYATRDEKEAIEHLRKLVKRQEPRSKFLNNDDISRFVPQAKVGAEKKYNVILVSIESMSAEFMQAFGSAENVTPNLDAFAKKGLLFTNLKATGTRTVRGLEALSLGVPPTPGNSIVRRQNNENLFNISSPLKDRGYEAKFLYGGDGYFDNMNYFFGNNGFEIVDRANFEKSEITFSNAWGVADEDLFNKAIKEADKSYAAGKPFLNFIMTTSNHRPFTYPEGKIDIAPKTGRNGAVKYTDYAIGKLVEEASKKPWFANTIFVFVADHCAGSAGNTDVPLWRYQIPAIFYAPKIIKPRVFEENVSQIDLAPTLMGVLNLGYKSKFFGTDVLNNQKTIDEHSFVSTYTDIGYFKNHRLFLLKPKKEKKVFNVELNNYGWNGSKETVTHEFAQENLNEAIAYYQVASHLFKNEKLKNFTSDKKN